MRQKVQLDPNPYRDRYGSWIRVRITNNADSHLWTKYYQFYQKNGAEPHRGAAQLQQMIKITKICQLLSVVTSYIFIALKCYRIYTLHN